MTKYLLLLKLDKSKLLETIDALRSLPKNPISGVDLNYTLNIFGNWHVAVWFSADKSAEAIDFINGKISKVPGVDDAFPVAAFPHIGQHKEREEASKGEESE
ncbi:MAG: hypothetical protein ACUVRA_04815 [Candidatus Bathyarchaeaceae archaeon]